MRGSNADTPYWRLALKYGLAGNHTSVLDEYFHWLREALGLTDQDPVDTVQQLGETAQEAVSVHTSRIQLDQFKILPELHSFSLDPFNLHIRFAMLKPPVKWISILFRCWKIAS